MEEEAERDSPDADHYTDWPGIRASINLELFADDHHHFGFHCLESCNKRPFTMPSSSRQKYGKTRLIDNYQAVAACRCGTTLS